MQALLTCRSGAVYTTRPPPPSGERHTAAAVLYCTVLHCTVLYCTVTSCLGSLACSPGYNGGLAQQLHLELRTAGRAGAVLANITATVNTSAAGDAESDVMFTVTKLPPDEKFDVVCYASNQKGKSAEKHLTAATLPMISGEKGIMLNQRETEMKSWL